NANVVLIENKASGTQLLQELAHEGMWAATGYEPQGDKLMRLHAQTGAIEAGFVFIPNEAPWLPEYLHELTVFPNGKHNDQADSTSQFLDWFSSAAQEPGLLGYARMRLARQLHDQDRLGDEETAARVKSTPDEIRLWREQWKQCNTKDNPWIRAYED